MEPPFDDVTGERLGPEPPHWGAVATVLLGTIIAVVHVVVSLVLFFGYAVWRGYESGRDGTSLSPTAFITGLGNDGTLTTLTEFVTTPVVLVLLFMFALLKPGATLTQAFALRPVEGSVLVRWTLGVLVYSIASDAFATWLGDRSGIDFMTGVVCTTRWPVALTLSLVVLAPLQEEFFFRGFMLNGLAQSRLGPVAAVLITSATWTVIHAQYDFPNLAGIFVMGLALGTARLKTGSLWLPLWLHAVNNGVSTAQWMLTTSCN